MPYDNTTFAYNGRVDDNDLRDPQIARIIAARFKEAKRKHKTLTEETNHDIARICGMSHSQLNGYLYCAPPVKLTVDRYTMLARYFGESPDHMLEMPDEWQLVDQAANDDDGVEAANDPNGELTHIPLQFRDPKHWTDQQIVDLFFERAPTMSADALKAIMNEAMAIGWGLESTTNTDHIQLDDKGWPL